MNIDIILEPDLAPSEIIELAVSAERYGVRAIWTSNYFAHWDAFMSLIPVAMSTTRILMGPLAVSPFEMHPLKIANSLLTLNEISHGRALVAIGAGEGNIDAMNLSRPPKIVGAMREATEIIRGAGHKQLHSGYQGDHFQINFPCDFPWLKSSPPLVYITAYREQMMSMAGRRADGVYIGCTPPECIDTAIEAITSGIDRRQAGMPRLHKTTFWAWHVKHDRNDAYRESRRELAWRARKLDPELLSSILTPDEVSIVRNNYDNFVSAWFDRSGNIKGVPVELANRLCEFFTSTGGLEELDREIERLRLFSAAGLTEVALRLHDQPMDALDIIGTRVIPALSS